MRRTLAVALALVAALFLLVGGSVTAGAQQATPGAASDQPAGATPTPAGATPAPAAGDPTPAAGLGAPLDPAALNPYAAGGLDATGLAAPPPPTVVGSGTDALLRRPDLRGADEPTLFERYGAAGYTISGADSATSSPLNAASAALFAIATWIASGTVAIVQWAFSLELFGFVGDAVEAIVGALERTVYLPFVQVAVVSAGLYALWQGAVRKRGTLAGESLVWAVGALAAAALFFAAPRGVINVADTLTTGLSRATLTAVSVADPQTGPDDGVTATPTFTGDAASTELRVAADRFWRVFVYQPWLVLQFGDATVGRDYGERLLTAQTVQQEEFDAAVQSEDAEALPALLSAKRDEYQALSDEIGADPAAGAWFQGQRPVERVGVASLALAGVVVGGVLMALLAGAVLVAQLAFLLLVLLGPIALLLGIQPGGGRVIATRWAQLGVGVLIRRVVLAALLSVVLVVNGVLLDATYPLGWLVVMGLQVLVLAAVYAYRGAFRGLMVSTTPAGAASATETLRTTVRERLERRRELESQPRSAPARQRSEPVRAGVGGRGGDTSGAGSGVRRSPGDSGGGPAYQRRPSAADVVRPRARSAPDGPPLDRGGATRADRGSRPGSPSTAQEGHVPADGAAALRRAAEESGAGPDRSALAGRDHERS